MFAERATACPVLCVYEIENKPTLPSYLINKQKINKKKNWSERSACAVCMAYAVATIFVASYNHTPLAYNRAPPVDNHTPPALDYDWFQFRNS